MKQRLLALLLAGGLFLSMSSCSKKITLTLAFGEREGIYSGNLVDGLPDGYGTFKTANEDGSEWTYEGNWSKGHFEGEGKMVWKDGGMEIGTYHEDVIVPMKGDELKTLYTSPGDYQYHVIDIVGKIFTSPEYDENGVGFQMWGDYKNSANNTVVYVPDPNFKPQSNEYIHIVGRVGDVFKGTNAFGGEVTAPSLIAKEYEILSYQQAVSPTLKEISVNQKQTQLGYTVSVVKVELAETETRVYIRIDNQGSDEFNMYSFNARLVQNGKQYKEQSNWEADYPEIETGLLPGNQTDGIIAFPNIQEGNFKLLLEASSDNWHEKIQDFVFEIAMPGKTGV